MVAERRTPSRAGPAKGEKARSRSPGPGKTSGQRGKGASETPADQDTQSIPWGGLLAVVGLVAAVGAMVVLGVPRNASLVDSGAADGAGVNLMGFSQLEVDAFCSSLTMILVSEVGDKTFFIAAVLAMRHSRAVVLGGALGALALMTVLSAIIGEILTKLIPHQYTHYAAVGLFIVFGIKLLKDAQGMSAGGPSEELEEVEAELSKDDKKKDPDAAAGGGQKKDMTLSLVNSVLWQAFTLTFLAEWGDRSQVSTIALAAKTKDAISVTAGGVLGHACCTSLAVVGGRLLASRISERTVTLAGGALFLIFAVHGMLQDPTSSHND
jgi:putative Ca2+/H+ antiporter (TMEM165/GDT1 family)